MMSEIHTKTFAGFVDKIQGHLGKILHLIVKYTHRPAFRWPDLTSQDWLRAIFNDLSLGPPNNHA